MQINKAHLLKALAAVKPGLGSKEIIEQSTSFAFMANNIVTFNDEIAVRHPIDLDITGAVRANELYSLLAKTTSDEIELEVTDNELLVSGGKTNAGLILEKEVRLPLEELGELEDTWIALPDGYLKALKLASFCTSRDMSKPVLTCIHTKGRYVEASDDFRLIRYDLGKKASRSFPESLLIPASAIQSLTSYDLDEFTKSPGWVHFRAKSGLVFSCRTFSDEFPEIDHFFDVKGVELEFPESTRDAIEKAQIFSEGMTDSDEKISFRIKNGRLTVKGEGPYGWFSETASCTYKGEPIKFSIAPSFLADIIKQLQHCIVGENLLKFQSKNFEHVVALID